MPVSVAGSEEDLAILRGSALRMVTLGVLGIAGLQLWYIAFFAKTAGLAPGAIFVLLTLAWATTSIVWHWNDRAAVVVLVGCLEFSTLAAIHLYPGGLVALVFGPIVAIASVLLGTPFGCALAIADTLVVVAEESDLLAPGYALFLTGPNVSTQAGSAAVASIWGSLILIWMLWRPVDTVLRWSWESARRSQEKTEQLREQQVKLSQTNRNLSEAYDRLEQLSSQLDLARRAAEDARLLKSEFAATVSHELRTPLNLIIGFSEMMLMGPHARSDDGIPDRYRGDVEAIYRNATHLSSLIDDILDLSQVDAHRLGLKRGPTVLSQIVEEAILAIDTMFREKGLGLIAELPEDLPLLFVDRTRIRQVLINLLNNAARFTSRGGVTIRATCDEHDVTVSVADTGIGIPPDEIATVFEEFHQIGPRSSRRHSGLGLTICKRLVELHGGNIWLESSRDSGTTFFFSLPRAENVVARSIDQGLNIFAQKLHHNRQPLSIGLLDDDPEVLKIFTRYLDGYRVVPISDPRSLKEMIPPTPVQALVVTAPGADGDHRMDVLPAAGLEKLLTTPVVLCPMRAGHAIARRLGVSSYLRKPVSRDQIAAALRQLQRPIHRALVVDDDPDTARLMARMVRAEFPGCRAARAHGGREALDLLQRWPPDVILLDLLMPDLDGRGVLERLRNDQRLATIPVVIVTATGVEDEAVTADRLEITRANGLTVGEVMRCLQGALDVLLAVDSGSTYPMRQAGLVD